MKVCKIFFVSTNRSKWCSAILEWDSLDPLPAVPSSKASPADYGRSGVWVEQGDQLRQLPIIVPRGSKLREVRLHSRPWTVLCAVSRTLCGIPRQSGHHSVWNPLNDRACFFVCWLGRKFSKIGNLKPLETWLNNDNHELLRNGKQEAVGIYTTITQEIPLTL